MNIYAEIEGYDEHWMVAQLAVAYSLLAMAPYDSWSHEGSPAEMAVFVVKTAKERGSFGALQDALGPIPRERHWARTSGLSMQERDRYYEMGRENARQGMERERRDRDAEQG